MGLVLGPYVPHNAQVVGRGIHGVLYFWSLIIIKGTSTWRSNCKLFCRAVCRSCSCCTRVGRKCRASTKITCGGKRLESKDEVLGTLLGTSIYYPPKRHIWVDDLPFPKVGYEFVPWMVSKVHGEFRSASCCFFLCPSWMSIYPVVVVGKTRLFRPV